MRSGYWFGSVLCVSFSEMTQLVWWQEHPGHKNNLYHLSAGPD